MMNVRVMTSDNYLYIHKAEIQYYVEHFVSRCVYTCCRRTAASAIDAGHLLFAAKVWKWVALFTGNFNRFIECTLPYQLTHEWLAYT